MSAPRNARRNAEIVRLRRTGWAPCDIARLMRLTPGTVGAVLHRAGLCDPANNPAGPDMPEHIREAISAAKRRLWSDPARRESLMARLHDVKPWTKAPQARRRGGRDEGVGA